LPEKNYCKKRFNEKQKKIEKKITQNHKKIKESHLPMGFRRSIRPNDNEKAA
jgi:hypothetical protein